MSTEPGLRERKKQQTRELIAETARRLFSERGFDSVTVAEVAKAADLSEGTVFNYFPAKEDIFFSALESFEAKLVEAVRARERGETVLTAFRRVVLDGSVRLAGDEVADVIATAARIIASSSTLQARERDIAAHYTSELAALLAEETAAGAEDVEPWAVANALMGAHQGLVHYVRSRVLGGAQGPGLAADVRSQGTRVFVRLECGLADYAPKQG